MKELSKIIPGEFNPDERIIEIIKGGHFVMAMSHIGLGDYILSASDWRELRDEIFERDGRLCAYCAAPATAIDHVIAKARGGLTVAANLVPACKSCNSRKGARRGVNG